RTVLTYAENSIYPQDLDLVAHALASGIRGETSDGAVVVESAQPVVFRTGVSSATTAFLVDGEPWPCVSGGDVLLPAGQHKVATGSAARSRPGLMKLNGELLQASYERDGSILFSSRADATAIALFDRTPSAILLDGTAMKGTPWVLLPSGRHTIAAS